MERLKSLIKWANEHGLQPPMIHDPKKGRASVSLTLLFLSSVTVLVSLFAPLFPQLEKVNFWQALAWYVTSAVLYYNRHAKISKDGIEISSAPEEK